MYKHLKKGLTVCNLDSACYDKKSLLRQLYFALPRFKERMLTCVGVSR